MNENNHFHNEVASRWENIFNTLNFSRSISKSWIDIPTIREILSLIVMPNTIHTHYPTSGGLDWQNISSTFESDCVAINTSDKHVDVFSPSKITAEYFPESPRESFILIDLNHLDKVNDINTYKELRQELVELPPDEYVDRGLWENGSIGRDENEREIPIPDDARLVSRWLGGKLLLVAKGSIWNGSPSTYNGNHNQMTNTEIRDFIRQNM